MRRIGCVLLFLTFVIPCIPLRAQTVDTAIIGTVTDATGAIVPGATVTVLSTATGFKKTAVAGSTGEYRVTYLIPGTYDISVSANGFGAYQRKGVTIDIEQQAQINVVLNVGGVSQVVKVEGNPPLLQTQDSSMGGVVGTTAAVNLPLNGRRFDDLAILTPGVSTYDPDNHVNIEQGAGINAYGNQPSWAQTNVDGITMVSNRENFINLHPSVDAIQEFRVYTSNAEAEYGGGAGAITNIQLRSGSNNWHGDLFEFVRNTAMDARNYFLIAPAPKQVLKQNQFGGTFGGPILKDRSFFFVSYEGIRSLEQSAGTTKVLTAAEKNGDFSAILPTIQLVSPYTGLPYVGNQIPVNPVAQNIALAYMPAPNTNQNGQNYAFVSGGNEIANQYIARLDDKINDANSLAFHFMYQSRNVHMQNANPNFADNSTWPIYNVALQYVHTVSANMVNELRLGFYYEHEKELNTLNGTDFTPASIGINGFVRPDGSPWPPSETGFPTLATNDLLGMGSDDLGLDNGATYQLVDNFTWTKGRHTLIFGGDIRHAQDNANTSNNPWGSISFNGSETSNNAPGAPSNESGFDGADFILGLPSSVITPEGVPLTAARQWHTALYLQDNWKATSNLTLNLGLRWDLWAPPHNNLDTSQDLNWSTPTPTLIPLRDPLWQVTHKDFAPRVGFAYSLPHQFVVRGAYGISYYGGKFDNINILQLNPPIDPSFSLTNGNCGYCTPSNAPTATIEYPVSPSITPATPNVVSTAPDGKHPDLYLQTWNLTFSKQFWSNVIDVSYIGVKGTHQDTSLGNFNVGPPQVPGSNVQANRPYPIYGQMRVEDQHGASIYEGLAVHFEHRLSHSLEFTTAYTLSLLRDNQGGDTNGPRNQTQIATQKVWANGLTDQRNLLTVALVWQLPKLSGGNVAERAILNGWGINGIFQVISGSPLFVNQAADGQNNGNAYEYPDLVPGQSMTVAHRNVARWFNPDAFTEAVGHYGNTPRNPSAITAPTNNPLTLAVNRSFPMPFKDQHLDFRIEAFNALNHPQFGAPNTTQGSGIMGVITNTQIDNRELQLSLKYIF
jgi:hypothetical protein